MSDPYLGQIMMAAFDYAASGYHLCDGTLLPIQQNQALYSLLGVVYGGDARTTFGLPDLRGATMVGQGQLSGGTIYVMQAGHATGGAENVTLTSATVPPHLHQVVASTQPGNTNVANHIFSAAASQLGGPVMPLYALPGNTTVPLANPVAVVGGGAAHNNMQPFLVLNFMIANVGYYPQRP